MSLNNNSNITKSQKIEALDLATEQLQKIFSDFFNSCNKTFEEIQHYEKQLINQLQEIEKQKEKLSEAYQQEHQYAQKLHKVLESMHDIFNAENEKEVFNKVFNVLTTLYPKAVIKILSNSKDSQVLSTILTTKDTNTEGEWLSTSPAKLLDNKKYYLYIADKNGMPIIKENDEDIINLIITHSNLAINKLHRFNALKKESHTDVLTGLPNRRYALKILEKEINRSKRYNDIFSIAIIDVDNFKMVNDTYGHDEGDRVLSLLADVAASCFRSTDTMARFGGEEFLTILPKTSGHAAVQVLNRFRNAFNRAAFTEKLKVRDITISAGIAQYPVDGEDVELL